MSNSNSKKEIQPSEEALDEFYKARVEALN
jgi:hypothetical protein